MAARIVLVALALLVAGVTVTTAQTKTKRTLTFNGELVKYDVAKNAVTKIEFLSNGLKDSQKVNKGTKFIFDNGTPKKELNSKTVLTDADAKQHFQETKPVRVAVTLQGSSIGIDS